MTLRAALNGQARRLHDQLDELLDREDGVIVFMDGRRLVSYVNGFGVSPCQLELLAVALERAVRELVPVDRLPASTSVQSTSVRKVKEGGEDT